MMALSLALTAAVGAWLYATDAFVPARAGHAAVFTLITGALLSCSAVRGTPLSRGSGRRWGSAAASFLSLFVAVASAQTVFHLLYWRTVPYFRVSVGADELAGLFRLLGLDAAAADGLIAIQKLDRVVQIRPTLERLGVYSIGLFLVGAWASVVLWGARRRLATGLLSLILCAAYAILRFVTMALLSSDLGRTEMFWNPAVTLVSIVPLTLLAAAWLPRCVYEPATASPRRAAPVRLSAAVVLTLLGAAVGAFSATYEFPGERKAGRVLLDDFHSGHWEKSTGEFGPESYGQDAIYNYVLLRQWLSEFYDVRVDVDQRLSDELLAEVDVLVLKTPTQPFLEGERDAVVRFVESGGGLWLVGDHTNLFGMSTYLNPMGAAFGLRFRLDDTFDLTNGQPSRYRPPLFGRHPAVALLDEMTFQTSATIVAPFSARPVMVGYGLGSEYVDYGHVNFFGNIQVDPQDEYGLFLQAAAVSHGRGRVLAFSDSTVFSNFAMFLPGISELALGSVEYLNRREGNRAVIPILAGGGAVVLFAGILLASPWRRRRTGSVVWGSVPIGLLLGGAAATSRNMADYPMPPSRATAPRVVVDDSICSFRLPSSLDYTVTDSERCFDAFYLNLGRLGLHPGIADGLGADAVQGVARVFLYPTRLPSESDLGELRRFVEGGGRVAVFETRAFTSPATRAMLEALGLAPVAAAGGQRSAPAGATVEPISIPAELRPRLENDVAVYEKRLGAGKVMFISGAEWFSRKYLGQVYKSPNLLEREWHRVQYYVIDRLMDRVANDHESS